MFISVLVLGAPGSGLAQDLDAMLEDPELLRVDPVVVTGTRREQSHEDAPVATAVVTREEMRAEGSESVAEALAQRPGLEVVSSFRGQALRMRGLDPAHVLVLVDGERLVGRVDGAVDLSRIRTEDVERIEIVHGALSALYGSDAIGGVVNIITRRPEEPLEGEAHVSAGVMAPFGKGSPFGEDGQGDASGGAVLDASAVGGLRTDDLSLSLSAGYHHADAYDLFPEDEATSGSAYDEARIGARAGWDVGPRLRIAARTSYRRRDERAVDAGGRALFDREKATEELLASLAPRVDLGDRGELELRGWYTLYRDQLLSDQRGSDALDSYEDNREHLAQVTAQWSAPLHIDHQLTVGYEAMAQVLEGERIEGSGRRGRLAVFAQHEWTLSDEPYLVVVPGARLDIDTQFGTHPTPKLAVRLDPIEEVLVLRLSAGLGYRAPSFKELLLRFENPSAGYVVTGNPDLGPETSWSVDAGAEWRPVEPLSLSLALYRNQVEDLIDIASTGTTAGRTEYTYVNIASAHTQGVEVTAGWRPVEALRVELGYALTDTEDETQGRALEGRALHRWTLRTVARHDGSGLSAAVRGSVVAERPFYVDTDGDGEDETVHAPAYAAVDLRVALDLGEHLTVFTGVDNALGAGGQHLEVRPRTFYGGATARY